MRKTWLLKRRFQAILLLAIAIATFFSVLIFSSGTYAKLRPVNFGNLSIGSARIVECNSVPSGESSGLEINQQRYKDGKLKFPKILDIRPHMCLKPDIERTLKPKILPIEKEKHALKVNSRDSYAKLSFYSDVKAQKALPVQELVISGKNTGIGYFYFPCTGQGTAHIEFRKNANPETKPECKFRVRPKRTLNSVSKETRLVSQKTKSLEVKKSDSSDAFMISQGFEDDRRLVRYYCSAMADLGRPPGLKGRPWGIGLSDGSRTQLFSQNDPCRQAIRDCESKSPGLSCSVVTEGEWTVDESKSASVSLKCNDSLVDSKRLKSLEVNAYVETLKDWQIKKGEGSCSLNIYDDDEVILSSSASSNEQVFVTAISLQDSIEISVPSISKGAVNVQLTDPKSGEEKVKRLEPKKLCLYSSKDGLSCESEPLPPEKDVKNVQSEDFKSLLRPDQLGILAQLDEPFEAYTMDGQKVRPNRCLGGTVRLPDSWKLVLNQKHLKLAQKHVQRKDQRLASAYVDQSLSLLKQKSSSVGNIFETEIKQYLSSNECQLVAIDTGDLAGISVTRQVLDSGKTLNSLVDGRVQQLQTTNSDIVQFVSYQNDQTSGITTQEQPTWKIQSLLNLKSAFGETFVRRYKSPPIEDLPSIGAGQTRATGGQKGESVSLVHTSYLFKNRFAKQQNEYFVINFVTTPERMSQYQQSFQDILQSFRFLLPKV